MKLNICVLFQIGHNIVFCREVFHKVCYTVMVWWCHKENLRQYIEHMLLGIDQNNGLIIYHTRQSH